MRNLNKTILFLSICIQIFFIVPSLHAATLPKATILGIKNTGGAWKATVFFVGTNADWDNVNGYNTTNHTVPASSLVIHKLNGLNQPATPNADVYGSGTYTLELNNSLFHTIKEIPLLFTYTSDYTYKLSVFADPDEWFGDWTKISSPPENLIFSFSENGQLVIPDTSGPTISITQPLAQGEEIATGELNVRVQVSDPSGITKVSFFIDDVFQGDATTPYSGTLLNGVYQKATNLTGNPGEVRTLKAVAYDFYGHTTIAEGTVTIFGGSSDTTPPEIELVSPTPEEGATLSIGADVVLKATATDNVGIEVVKFYISGTTDPVGTDHHSPYTAENWTPSVAGTYTITATAIDTAGNTTISFGRNITVIAGGGQQGTDPSVMLTGIEDGATYSLGQSVSMAAVPSNIPNAAVVFHQNNTPIQTDTSSPYSITWTPATAGTYAVKAIASNATGATATSVIKNITVGTGGGNGQTIPPVTQGNVTISNVTVTVNGQTATIAGKIAPTTGSSTLSLFSNATHTTVVSTHPLQVNSQSGVFTLSIPSLTNGTYYFTITNS
jgi:hypothetical protein